MEFGQHFEFTTGVLAQLVERLNGIEEVRGSNPLGSTFLFRPKLVPNHWLESSYRGLKNGKRNQSYAIVVY
jgi:hypothetical protein